MSVQFEAGWTGTETKPPNSQRHAAYKCEYKYKQKQKYIILAMADMSLVKNEG